MNCFILFQSVILQTVVTFFYSNVFPATFCFLMKDNFQILCAVKQHIVEDQCN